ncbi:MAG: MFS transporter [Candidatus Bathyarchaeia archaeon]
MKFRISRSASILLIGFFIVFIHYSIRYSYGILLPKMEPSLNISKFESGIIYTSYFVGYTVFSVPLGIFVDRFDARKLIAFFLLILGLGTFFMSLSSTLIEASLSFMLAGIGCAACWVPVVVVVQRWFKKRAFAVSIANMGAPIGFALTGVIVPLLVKIGGWRLGWRVFGATSILLAPITWLSIRSYPENYAKKGNGISKDFLKKAYATIVKNIKLWLAGFSYMFVGFYIMVPFTFLSAYASQEMPIVYDYASMLVSMIAFGAIPGMLILASLSEVIGRLKIMVLCGCISTIGILGIASAQFFPGLEFTILALSTVFYGVGYGAVWPLYAVYVSDIFSMEYGGVVLGLMTIFLGVGCMLSPPVAGWVADTTGTLRSSFLVASAVSVLSVLCLLPMWKR